MDFNQAKSSTVTLQLSRGGLSEDLVVILSGKDMTKGDFTYHFSHLLGLLRSGESIIIDYQEEMEE